MFVDDFPLYVMLIFLSGHTDQKLIGPPPPQLSGNPSSLSISDRVCVNDKPLGRVGMSRDCRALGYFELSHQCLFTVNQSR